MQRKSSTLVLSFSNAPGVHCSTTLQKGWLVSSWYLPEGQAVHSWALLIVEYVPAGQGRHRESSRLVLSASNCPGVHWTLVLQNGWLVLSWYLPEGQTVHSRSLLIAVYLSAGQGSQATELMNWPGMQSAQ